MVSFPSVRSSLHSYGKKLDSIENDLQIVARSLECLPTNRNQSPDADKCRRDLFLTDPRTHRERLKREKGSVIVGSCDWVPETPQYKSWSDSTGGVLWVCGGPGTGKTMLSIYLSERLERDAQARDTPSLVLYFFCDNRDNERNGAIQMLRGLLYHLVELRPGLIKHMLSAHKVQGKRLFDGDIDKIWDVFLQTIDDPDVPLVTCVMDGLDECDESSLTSLLLKIESLAPTDKLKVLVLSREHPKCIRESLVSRPQIKLDAALESVSDGLELYINTRVAELAESSPHYPQLLIERIRKSLITGSGGVFLWVSFMIQDLRGKEPSEVVDCLNDLPEGLYEIYERILNQIKPRHRNQVKALLTWVVFAEWPLSLEELVEALAVEETNGLNPSQIVRDYVRFCGHLLTVSETGRVVRFVHQSAKDYLVQARKPPNLSWTPVFDADTGHSTLATGCIACMHRRFKFSDVPWKDDYRGRLLSGSETGRLDESGALIPYAKNFWDFHFKASGHKAREVLEGHSSFFKGSELLYHQLHTEFRMDRPGLVFVDSENIVDRPAFHIACGLGLHAWAEYILENHKPALRLSRLANVAVSVRENRKWTPLNFAVCSGCYTTTKLLIRHGADVNFITSAGKSPLWMSVYMGLQSITDLLLSHGAKPYPLRGEWAIITKQRKCQSPLKPAVERGDKSLIKLLLEHGADPNARLYRRELDWTGKNTMERIYSENDGTLLEVAVRYHNLPMVEWLVRECGRDTKGSIDDGETLKARSSPTGWAGMANFLRRHAGK